MILARIEGGDYFSYISDQ